MSLKLDPKEKIRRANERAGKRAYTQMIIHLIKVGVRTGFLDLGELDEIQAEVETIGCQKNRSDGPSDFPDPE